MPEEIVQAVLASLANRKWVVRDHAAQVLGITNNAAVYSPNSEAAYVIGVSLHPGRVEGVLLDAYAQVLHRSNTPTSNSDPETMIDASVVIIKQMRDIAVDMRRSADAGGQQRNATVRSTATMARPTGDEFVVVDTVRDATELGKIAERLLSAVNSPVTIDSIQIVPSASIGAALTGPDDTADQLLRHADIAMYRAKARGRNTWHLHDAGVSDPATDRLRVIGELRQGIDRGELRVHYQPRIELRTGRVHSAEALVRWEHPTRGLLPPVHFIDIAEQSGLICKLGAYVLDRAVAQAAAWYSEAPGTQPIEMAVNLSPRQLTDPNMVSIVTETLQRHRMDPARLTLEITETALMTDPDAAMVSLAALNALGVMLAVDDFGTGYSSLTYLKQFPIQELKIDQSFVAGLGVDSGDTAIVASCIQLAHGIGIRAVAEGVETDDQRRALIDMHCDLAQGYFYSRPVPAQLFSTATTPPDTDEARTASAPPAARFTTMADLGRS